MKKSFRFSVLLFLFIFVIFPMIEPVYVSAGALTTQAFKPLSNKEKVVGFTKIGSWNNGSFFETITHELVGFDDDAMTMKYHIREVLVPIFIKKYLSVFSSIIKRLQPFPAGLISI